MLYRTSCNLVSCHFSSVLLLSKFVNQRELKMLSIGVRMHLYSLLSVFFFYYSEKKYEFLTHSRSNFSQNSLFFVFEKIKLVCFF